MRDSEKHKQSKHDWYEKNKELTAQRSREARLKKREWYLNILSDKFCEHCGENDPVVLDWHHTDPTKKEATISWLLQNRSKKAIVEEMDKCICLCANCHRRVHNNRV